MLTVSYNKDGKIEAFTINGEECQILLDTFLNLFMPSDLKIDDAPAIINLLLKGAYNG